MTLRLRHLRLRVRTASGLFGTDISFTNGLTVLWADNTRGKSTCVQSIIYALGLERMLSSQRDIPLPYAMTDYLKEGDPGSEVEHQVLSSTVWLEIENGIGAVCTLRRQAKGEQSTKLISVIEGPTLTGEGEGETRDYFVRDPGSATREAGFHTFLASFLGWQLPTVTKYDGRETLLYLETIFPLFYVEQKFGWSSFPAAFPTYLGIRDMGRKAAEFVLALDTHENELRRERLTQQLSAIRADWTAKRDALIGLAKVEGAALSRLPSAADTGFDELADLTVFVQIDDEQTTLAEAIRRLRDRISSSRRQALRTSEEIAPEARRELEQLTDRLSQLQAERVAKFRRRELEFAQIQSLKDRLDSLEVDLRKNKDVRKLQELGSGVTQLDVAHECPTCSQPISDVLLPQEGLGPVMSVEQNIAFLEAQRDIFRALLRQSERSAVTASNDLAGTLNLLNETSGRIRALRADLIAPGSTPSESEIENRVRWDRRIRALETLETSITEEIEVLKEVSANYLDIRGALGELPKERLSEQDQQKVDVFVSLMREQLGQYGFSTFAPAQLTVSENFRVEKEGFEIGFQASASDTIRLKWAYQLALLEVARTRATHHAGLVIFDEPRQQEASKPSFRNLLARASRSDEYNQQVFFATSEDQEELRQDLSGLNCNFIVIDGWTLSRIS